MVESIIVGELVAILGFLLHLEFRVGRLCGLLRGHIEGHHHILTKQEAEDAA